MSGLIEFAKGLAEFLFIVVMIVVIAWRRTKTYQDALASLKPKFRHRLERIDGGSRELPSNLMRASTLN